jgi:hypothetical protein
MIIKPQHVAGTLQTTNSYVPRSLWVGIIATGYGLEGRGIESRWGGRDFPHPSRPALGFTRLMYNGYRVFPGGKERPGETLIPHSLLVPWSWKGRAIPLLPLWAVYRASVPVKGRTLPFFYLSRSLPSNSVLNNYVLVTHKDEAGSSGYDIDDVELSQKLQTEAVFDSETSVNFYHITRRHTP